MSENLVVYFPVIIGAVGLLIGLLFGVLIARARRPKGEPGLKLDKNLQELLRLYRDQNSGALAMVVGKQVVKKPEELPEKARRALARLHADFGAWLGVAEQKPHPAPAVLQPPGVVTPPAAETAAATLPPIRLESFAQPVSDVKPVSVTVDSILANAISPEKTKNNPPPKSIAAQIDEIVTEKLPLSAVKDRYIHIMELPVRGVVVCVDNKEYEGVGDVEDPQAKAFLKECVAEWERRVGTEKR